MWFRGFRKYSSGLDALNKAVVPVSKACSLSVDIYLSREICAAYSLS